MNFKLKIAEVIKDIWRTKRLPAVKISLPGKKILLLQIGKTHYQALIAQPQKDVNMMLWFSGGTWTDFSDVARSLASAEVTYDEIFILLSRDQFTIRNIELPTVDPQEINDIIDIQAAKQTPFSRDEIISDYKILDSHRNNYTPVFLAIIQRHLVDQLIKLCAPLEKNVRVLALRTEGLRFWTPVVENLIGEDTFAIIDYTDHYCDFAVFSRQKLLYTRILQLSGADISKSPGVSKLFEEVALSLKIYNTEKIGLAFEQIIIIGDPVVTSKVLAAIEVRRENLKTLGLDSYFFKTVDLMHESAGIQFSKEFAEPSAFSEKYSLLPLMGLAMGAVHVSSFLNFMPREVKELRLKEDKTKEIIRTGIFGLIALMMLGLCVVEKQFSQSIELENLDLKLKKLEQQTDTIRIEKLKIDLVKNHLNAENSVIELLSKVYKMTPETLYLSAITLNKEHGLALRGTAKSVAEVTDFAKKLQESGFYKAGTKYFSERKIDNMTVVDFEIECQIQR